MLLQNRSLCCYALCLTAVALALPTILLQALEVQAQPALGQLLAARPRNASNSSQGGGVRSECPVGNKSLRALIKDTDPGHTTQERPTFWFYLPFGKTTYAPVNQTRLVTVSTAKFVLLDEKRRFVARAIVLPLPDQAGIVRFTLPTSVKPLEVTKDYQWFFELSCGDAKTGGGSENPKISGWMTRVSMDAKLVRQLKATAASAQYKVLQESKLWFESVTQLADHRSQAPDAWKTLLTDFGLQEFAQKPIIELRPVMRQPAMQPPLKK